MSKRKIDDLLEAGHQRFSPLQKLLRQAESQEAATAEFRALLPAPLKKSCRIIDTTPPNMKVACRTAAAATKVRFLAPELIEQLRSLPQYSSIEKLSVRVIES